MATAQPLSTSSMAYTTIDENTLYVQGGQVYNGLESAPNASDQFYSLDLTQSWNTSSPPWKKLTPPDGLKGAHGHSISVAPDSRTFTIWVFNKTRINVIYNIDNNTWSSPPSPVSKEVISRIGLKAATDPTTGLVYIPDPGNLRNSMAVYGPSLEAVTTLTFDSELGTISENYSFAWCQLRKSFILFTGYFATVSFFEYSPTTSGWSRLVSYFLSMRNKTIGVSTVNNYSPLTRVYYVPLTNRLHLEITLHGNTAVVWFLVWTRHGK